jgi:hypothetical protein
MRRITVLVVVAVCLAASCDNEPRLDGHSLLALHESTESMKKALALSKKDAAALDAAIDVLVGDATREMLAAAESSAESAIGPERLAAEARVLQPIDDLSLREVIANAALKTNRELEGLLAELGEYEAIAAEHQTHLDRITVVRTGYGMNLASRRSWIDVTVRNGTDRRLTELLFDCRLIEDGTGTREESTCRAAFAGGLAPGTTGIAQSFVGWESEPRPTRRVEARPIRAYGDRQAVLWQVPSELDPRETGPIGDLKNRVAVLDGSLRRLKDVALPDPN